MSKIEATIFSAEHLGEEDAQQLSELTEVVTQLIEREAGLTEIRTAYDELIETCFDLRQYEMALGGLNFLRENSSELELSDVETANLYRKFGTIAFLKKETDEAKTEFNKALNLVKEDVDVTLEAKLLCDLGNVAATEADVSEAIEYYEAAIELSEEHGIEMPEPFINLGLMYLETENIGEAIECFETALELYGEEEALDKQEMLHLQLGNIYAVQSNYKDALLNYHYASELQEEDTEILAKTYVAMAGVLSAMAEHDKSIEYYEKALPILLKHGDIEVKSQHYFQLANLYTRYKEDYARALECYKSALEIAKTEEEHQEWRDLMVAKLEDSIEVAEESLSKFSSKKSKKSGFFGKLFGK
jgi:tetratricopeptide (TPR) repeat protein